MKTKIIIAFILGGILATAGSVYSAMIITNKGAVFYSAHGVMTTPEAITDIGASTRSIAPSTQSNDLPVVTVTATVPQQATGAPQQTYSTQKGITPEEARLRSIEARLQALELRSR